MFVGNDAGASGGAVDVYPAQTGTNVLVDVADSIFAQNSAGGVGGAVHIALPGGLGASPYQAPTFLAVNSNFAANAAGAGQHGGALSIWGNTTLVYSTVHENAGASQIQTTISNLTLPGGNAHGELFTFGTVIDNPAAGVGDNCAVASWMTNFGHSYSTDASCAALSAQADPMLFFDADFTSRSRPLAGSPLLDVIPPGDCVPANAESWPLSGAAVLTTNLSFDQLDVERPQGVGCDIGAARCASRVPRRPRWPVTLWFRRWANRSSAQ